MFLVFFAQAALLLAATNIVGSKDNKQIGASYTAQTEAIATVGHVVAVIATILIVILGYLFGPLYSVHTGLFGGLFVTLFVAVLSIINSSIQAPGGDIKGRFVEVVQAPAIGVTTGNFNGVCGPRGDTTAACVSGFFWAVLTAITVATIATVGAAKNLSALKAFDTIAALKEQVESTIDVKEGDEGGDYAKEMHKDFIDAEMTLFRKEFQDTIIIVTTSLISGKPAPQLILKDMADMMKPGSTIVCVHK